MNEWVYKKIVRALDHSPGYRSLIHAMAQLRVYFEYPEIIVTGQGVCVTMRFRNEEALKLYGEFEQLRREFIESTKRAYEREFAMMAGKDLDR